MNRAEQIKAQASEWLVRLSLDEADDNVRAEFDGWRQADPRHAAAYARFEEIWQASTAFDDLLEPAPSGLFTRFAESIKQVLARPAVALAMGVAAIVLLSIAVPTLWQGPAPQPFNTGIAEIRTITLRDGSQVTLGARSRITVSQVGAERRVALLSGEAFFAVAGNPGKPFVVDAGGAWVRVLGTEFNVRRAPQAVKVAVLAGQVKVTPPQALEGGQTLSAGQEVVAAQGGIPAPHAIQTAEPGAWRNGHLVYVDASLQEVIQDANRYSHTPIEIIGGALANLQVSATFRTDQIEQMLSRLEVALPVRVDRQSYPGRILLVAARGEVPGSGF